MHTLLRGLTDERPARMRVEQLSEVAYVALMMTGDAAASQSAPLRKDSFLGPGILSRSVLMRRHRRSGNTVQAIANRTMAPAKRVNIV